MTDFNLNITNITFAAGHDNTPHFSGAFKQLTGMRLRDYRRGLF